MNGFESCEAQWFLDDLVPDVDKLPRGVVGPLLLSYS
jgi:hypothetical protein